jgi:hypothetical protein
MGNRGGFAGDGLGGGVMGVEELECLIAQKAG